MWLVQLWLQVQDVRSWLFCPLPELTVQVVTPCRSAASDWLRWAWHWWWKPWRRRRSGFSSRTSVGSSSSGGLGTERRQDEGEELEQRQAIDHSLTFLQSKNKTLSAPFSSIELIKVSRHRSHTNKQNQSEINSCSAQSCPAASRSS